MIKTISKQSILFLLFISFSFSVIAQTEEGTFSADGKPVRGVGIVVSQPKEVVDKSFEEYLKSFGRVLSNKRYLSITDVQQLGLGEEVSLYSVTEASENGTKIHVGGVIEEIGEENYDKLRPQLSELLQKFKLRLSIEELEEQLIEAEGAAAYKSKIFQKLIKESGSLENSIQTNREEKEKLEERIKTLDEEYLTLQDKTELNKELKVLANEELEKINLRIEQLKKELSKF